MPQWHQWHRSKGLVSLWRVTHYIVNAQRVTASPLHRFIHPPPIVHSPYFTMSSVQIDAHRVAAPASADSLPPLPPLQILVDVAGASSEHLSSVEQLHQQNVLKAQQRMRGSAPSQSQGMFGTVMTAEFANLMISCIVSTFIEPVSSKKKRNAATKKKPKRQLSGAIRETLLTRSSVVLVRGTDINRSYLERRSWTSNDLITDRLLRTRTDESVTNIKKCISFFPK